MVRCPVRLSLKSLFTRSSQETQHQAMVVPDLMQESLIAHPKEPTGTRDDCQPSERGLRFWACIAALMVSSFLMVFELVCYIVPSVVQNCVLI